jgi:hypothetical protein
MRIAVLVNTGSKMLQCIEGILHCGNELLVCSLEQNKRALRGVRFRRLALAGHVLHRPLRLVRKTGQRLITS